jgi:hypothetical protein
MPMIVMTDQEANEYNQKMFKNLIPHDFFHVDHVKVLSNDKMTEFRSRQRLKYFYISKKSETDLNVFVFTEENIQNLLNGKPLIKSIFTYCDHDRINYQ